MNLSYESHHIVKGKNERGEDKDDAEYSERKAVPEMNTTESQINRLRTMVNDAIPNSGTDAETAFSNAELEEILTETNNIYQAASDIWILKAGMVQGGIESYAVGSEHYELTSMKDQYDHALAMASMYVERAGRS